MMGIGVDYGVHLIHDYLEQKGRYKITPSTAVAVLVDSLTTIVGFGAMMLASHRGLQSLGRVLTIGISCCLFTSLIMLPALLAWMSWNRGEGEEEEEEQEPRRSTPIPASVRLRRDGPDRTLPPPHAPAHERAERNVTRT
jgi:uncharacterized membrane protein YdfJ with MMPL/SSD domain